MFPSTPLPSTPLRERVTAQARSLSGVEGNEAEGMQSRTALFSAVLVKPLRNISC
jgi:hypothetical protein